MIINTYAEAKKYIKNKTIATHSQNAKYIFIDNKKMDFPIYYDKKTSEIFETETNIYILCPNCQSSIDENIKYCPFCNQKIY